MRPFSIIFTFLIAAAMFLSLDITLASWSSSSITSTCLTGRRMLMKLEFENPGLGQEVHNTKVVETDWTSMEAKGLEVGKTEVDDDEDRDGMIYHIDYHGVSTHPYPTPKHPRP